ncbi:type II toxin-antitoxin system Phd/YefM family antitoxin [Flexivirga alba]|uniref:Antitoxin n=1 Tax=Flexivirga alba TaxID=702742 RepID=A0ABW2AG18_9MICO
MPTVNVQEAKTHLSELLSRVERGENVVIARSGKPIAELRPIAKPALRFGTLSHLGDIGSGFLEPLDKEEQSRWEDGGPEDPLSA